jgi:hypothetical protein
MELSGTEESPDQASVGGQLADWLGPGQDGPFTRTNAAWATQDEHVRYGASAARPDLRWHYRYVAADLAAEAADNLPARSQAYAAVLCTAASWMESSHAQDRARALYRRYVATVRRPILQRQRPRSGNTKSRGPGISCTPTRQH